MNQELIKAIEKIGESNSIKAYNLNWDAMWVHFEMLGDISEDLKNNIIEAIRIQEDKLNFLQSR